MIYPVSNGNAAAAPESKFAGGPVAQPPFAKGDTVAISSKGHAAATTPVDVQYYGGGR